MTQQKPNVYVQLPSGYRRCLGRSQVLLLWGYIAVHGRNLMHPERRRSAAFTSRGPTGHSKSRAVYGPVAACIAQPGGGITFRETGRGSSREAVGSMDIPRVPGQAYS